MNDTNAQNGTLESLAKIQDPNKLIAACRAMAAEENQTPESQMFPFTEDSLGDVIYTFVGIWISMTVNLPIENKEQIIATINNMSEMLKQMQDHMSDDPEPFKRELLHSLRRAMAPRL